MEFATTSFAPHSRLAARDTSATVSLSNATYCAVINSLVQRRKVIFLNTDNVPAPEIQHEDNIVRNDVEASLVSLVRFKGIFIMELTL